MSRSLTIVPRSSADQQTIDLFPDTFEQWWKAYPRRVGKKAARIAYDRVVRNKIATPEELLAGAMRYAAERVNENPKYSKHPAGWLDDERWTDDPAPPRHHELSDAAIAILSYRVDEDKIP